MNVVYYSITNNTHRFVQKLDVPIYSVQDGIPPDSVLIVPTYGVAGIPKIVIKALREGHRERIRAIVGTGNINFGLNYCAGAIKLSQKLEVPLLHKLELAGNNQDVSTVLQKMEELEYASI